MEKKTEIEELINRFPESDLPGLKFLIELTLDLSWSWNHAVDEIWKKLDMPLWELTHNPWIVLQTVSFDKIKLLLADPAVKSKMDELQSKKARPGASNWFQEKYSDASLIRIAYFSMEYMLSEGLPIYSGGLGNVAGDQLKGANDMGVPVVAVGLLYQQGYFRQVIGKDGGQEALYPYNDPGQLPITPLRKPNGEWLRLQIGLPGYSVWLRAWEVRVGNVKLYLLDSNDAANYPAHRGITSELYGGGPELRLQQELILGIGGWRLLKELNIEPEVCHLNEGHAAFAVLERARHFMLQTGQSFDVALAVTRVGNLFTTHTAVSAGFDRFPPDLVAQYLKKYAENELGISLDGLLALGRINSLDASEPFNMAYLAVRGSGAVNGVSRLHREVSRELFQPLFPRWPKTEIPIGHVTNGVHMRSWDSKAADDLWTEACGKDRWMGAIAALDEHIQAVSDKKLWEMRTSARKTFIEYIRKRVPFDLAASGASAEDVEHAKYLFDPNTLTLGFARRFATYKRPGLLLHDKDRLIRILNNSPWPVQLAIAGKAHPADLEGQAIVKEWVNFSRRPEIKSRVVFLSDYDMFLSEQMVQGVDVWLNTPRRPWEASGTSGMKTLVNGGINFSELDGWWAEAYEPGVGWALGDGKEHEDNVAWDAVEANQLYTLLEDELIPEFYSPDEKGIPVAWTSKMRRSMAKLTPMFSTNRSITEYTELYYLPAVIAYRKRAAENGLAGIQIVNWLHGIDQKWAGLRFEEIRNETDGTHHIFTVQVFLNDLDPKTVSVELYADGINGSTPACERLQVNNHSKAPSGSVIYTGKVSSSRPETDFTARIIPDHEGISVPLENNRILWQR
ncbi:alpha-glucan family phosphorylase [Flavitalea flava]